MNVYLMRHAEAEDGPRNDPTRQLTSIGRKQATLMGEFLVRQIGRVDLVLCSYFARAISTASPIAEMLGCTTLIESAMLEPDAKPEEAWKEIKFIAGDDMEDVLVVTHHPLTNELLQLITGCDSEEFKHASVVHIKDGKLKWFIPPHVVERDEDEVLEAARKLSEALLEDIKEAKQPARGLQHERHQAVLAGAKTKLKKVFSGYFHSQGKAILNAVKPHIQRTIDQFTEAAGKGKRFADTLLPASVTPLRYEVTRAETEDYDAAITHAITGAGKVLAADLNTEGTLSDDVASNYLRDNSLSKLTGGFSDTTLDRLRNAVADAWDAGGSFDQITGAIQDTMEGFSDFRAEMIAQTEANDAYNAGRSAMADELGMEEKSWETQSGNPCDVCLGNEGDGWIDIGEDFSSGDDEPTAHPNCECSLNYRKGAPE
jgi:phosphohistidine phosphatase